MLKALLTAGWNVAFQERLLAQVAAVLSFAVNRARHTQRQLWGFSRTAPNTGLTLGASSTFFFLLRSTRALVMNSCGGSTAARGQEDKGSPSEKSLHQPSLTNEKVFCWCFCFLFRFVQAGNSPEQGPSHGWQSQRWVIFEARRSYFCQPGASPSKPRNVPRC